MDRFSRFAKQYARSHRETGGCTPISYGDLHEVSLFPSQLHGLNHLLDPREDEAILANNAGRLL